MDRPCADAAVGMATSVMFQTCIKRQPAGILRSSDHRPERTVGLPARVGLLSVCFLES